MNRNKGRRSYSSLGDFDELEDGGETEVLSVFSGGSRAIPFGKRDQDLFSSAALAM